MHLIKLFLLLITCCALSPIVLAQEEATPEDKLRAAAIEHRLTLDFKDGRFSGPGWDQLVLEGHEAGFFLVGEEHGIAENPLLVAQLFATLADDGYEQFVIEISPPMAEIIEDALDADGLAGLRKLFSQPGGEPAFFGMREEAKMLATINASKDGDVLWGVDYEVAGDRQLINGVGSNLKPGNCIGGGFGC